MLLGGAAGTLAYLLLLPLHSPWEELLAALLVGGLPALPSVPLAGAVRLSLATALGWLAGTIVFGWAMDLGIGAWILAGAGLGGAAGWVGRLAWRPALGSLLGLLCGVLVEGSRYLTLAAEPLHTWDEQFFLLLTAGWLLNVMAVMVTPLRPPGRR